jgi:tetratricopeptide (TPR) repeat protein
LDYDGDCEEAIAHFKDAIEMCPNYKNPYYNIWRAYKQDGQQEEVSESKITSFDLFLENLIFY